MAHIQTLPPVKCPKCGATMSNIRLDYDEIKKRYKESTRPVSVPVMCPNGHVVLLSVYTRNAKIDIRSISLGMLPIVEEAPASKFKNTVTGQAKALLFSIFRNGGEPLKEIISKITPEKVFSINIGMMIDAISTISKELFGAVKYPKKLVFENFVIYIKYIKEKNLAISIVGTHESQEFEDVLDRIAKIIKEKGIGYIVIKRDISKILAKYIEF